MINKKINTFTYLSLIAIFISCKNPNDFKIVKDKYILSLNSERLAIIEHSGYKAETLNVLPLLDTIIKQIENEGKVTDEVKSIINFNLTKWRNNKMYDPPEPYNYLISKKEIFMQGNMSEIETLDYIEKYFVFNYWINWRCNDSWHELVSFVKLDTLYLKSEKEYELQLQMQYNEIPSIRILSNTLQGNKPNRIKFKTKSHSEKLQIIPFLVKAINDANKQIYTFKDTIKYKALSND